MLFVSFCKPVNQIFVGSLVKIFQPGYRLHLVCKSALTFLRGLVVFNNISHVMIRETAC